MKSNILFCLAAILAISGSAFADVRIKTKQTMSGQSFENTTYIKAKRQRIEMMNGQMATITQCDLRRDLHINPMAKTYTISPFENGEALFAESGQTKVVKSPAGGVVYVTTTNKDTGERKQMFGYSARHIIQTIETKSSPESCHPMKSRMEIDAWVIDETFGFECGKSQDQRYAGVQKNSGGCRDKVVAKTLGTAKSGYPLYQKMTFFDDKGNMQSSMIQEVVEISRSTLDPSLFDIPNDYREAKSPSDMYGAATNSNTPASSGISGSMSLPRPDQNVSSETGTKKRGAVRIGLANIKAGSTGDSLNAADLSAAIQNTLADYLKGTKIELVALEAKLPSVMAEESKLKECDFVLAISASYKKGGGGGFGKMFGKMSEMVSRQAIGSSNIGGQIARSAIVSAALASGNVKAKDEISLDIRMQSGESVVLAKQYKAKAKSDGEDILSPMIEQAANAILDSANK